MNRLKEFLKKKKVKDNFKKAGPGRKLNDGTVVGTGYTVSPTSSVRREASSTSKVYYKFFMALVVQWSSSLCCILGCIFD